MFKNLMRKKKVGVHKYEFSLAPALHLLDLILLGVGAIIGAGVFVLTGVAAATHAGPGIILSYALAGLAALFAALSYAELSASIGTTGSAYSYAYVGFGELFAWIIGWDLILEYLMSVATVAIGWSGYVNNFFSALNINLPQHLTKTPFEGGTINLLAAVIVIALSFLLCFGIKHSARFNAAVVFIKIITIIVFIAVALPHVQIENWKPFLPYGWTGVIQGAALVFFAYIGFDALSTAVEESINPQRDVPIAIVVSLVICTFIYIVVSALLTGMVSYETLNVKSPVAFALLQIGHDITAGLVAAGAIAGLTTVMLVMYYGLTRICLAIARDGLLPIYFAKINARSHTPIRVILSLGVFMAIVAGLAPINRVAELVNIGTLAAFSFVCAGVIVFRYTHPEIERPFRLPLNPLIPGLGILFCVYLMLHLPWVTWFRFIMWMFTGLFIYFFYGYRHSLLKG